MADRVGVINRGDLILVDDTAALMARLGKKQLTLDAGRTAEGHPESLQDWDLGAGRRR